MDSQYSSHKSGLSRHDSPGNLGKLCWYLATSGDFVPVTAPRTMLSAVLDRLGVGFVAVTPVPGVDGENIVMYGCIVLTTVIAAAAGSFGYRLAAVRVTASAMALKPSCLVSSSGDCRSPPGGGRVRFVNAD